LQDGGIAFLTLPSCNPVILQSAILLLLLFLSAAVAGALNAIAGGGSFIALPVLLFAGVPPVAANATTTFALWPGTVASAVAYRSHVRAGVSTLLPLVLVSLTGGLLGGWLLVRTSDSGFMRVLPWLMLAAAITFTFSARFTATFRGRSAPLATIPWWAWLLQLVIATYGGYFGGGMGIMLLAAMSIGGMSDIHEMNGVKAILATVINGVALMELVAFGAVALSPGLVMAAGASLGGYAGASAARRVSARNLRWIVVAVAWTLTVYFFAA
jgi:uncharacterized membrane protein YfcA